jgi:hypothetical protein
MPICRTAYDGLLHVMVAGGAALVQASGALIVARAAQGLGGAIVTR